jgi:hypothetical protein
VSRRFERPIPEHLRGPNPVDHARDTGVLRLYLIAMGVAILLGLVGGSIWIAWRLLASHFAG